jgi:hypothetical protein
LAGLLLKLFEAVDQVAKPQNIKTESSLFIVAAHLANNASAKKEPIALANICLVVDIAPLLTLEE